MYRWSMKSRIMGPLPFVIPPISLPISPISLPLPQLPSDVLPVPFVPPAPRNTLPFPAPPQGLSGDLASSSLCCPGAPLRGNVRCEQVVRHGGMEEGRGQGSKKWADQTRSKAICKHLQRKMVARTPCLTAWRAEVQCTFTWSMSRSTDHLGLSLRFAGGRAGDGEFRGDSDGRGDGSAAAPTSPGTLSPLASANSVG